MAKISLKKDYMDGNVLYGKDLNPNFETIETTINANDDEQSETNASVNESITQLSSDMSQAKTDISGLQEDVADLETAVLDIPTKISELENDSGFVTEAAIPTKISQLENDDNTVKDADYVHTDNNYTDEDKTKLTNLSEYELPAATSDTLGGIKLGNGVVMDAFNALGLAVASASQLGGIKAGEGVSIATDGTLNVTGGGGSTGNGIPTITGTQEDPIRLYDFEDVPIGLAYISGYAKEVSNSEATNMFDRQLVYTSGENQFVGPMYEEDESSDDWFNLCFYFRPMMISVSHVQFTQPLVKFTYANVVSSSGQGYVTPKAVYDYVGALASLQTEDKTSIVNAINELVSSAGESGFDYLGFYGLVSLGQTPVTGQTFTNDFVYFTRTPVIGDTFLALGQQVSGPSYLLNCEITEVTDTSATYKLVAFTNTQGEQGPKGNTGAQGPQGPQGLPGPTGPGVPTGGTTGQVLSKSGNGDYDTVWKDMESGGIPKIYYLKATDDTKFNLFDEEYLKYGIYICDSDTNSANDFTNGLGYRYCPFIRMVLPFNQSDTMDNRTYVKVIELRGDDLYIGRCNASNPTSYSTNESYTLELNKTFHHNNGIASSSLTNKLAKAIDGKGSGLNIALSDLQTTDKTSLIAAINELNTRLAALENPTE